MQGLSDVLTSKILLVMLDDWFNKQGGRKTSRERLMEIETKPITLKNTVGLKLNKKKTAKQSGHVLQERFSISV